MLRMIALYGASLIAAGWGLAHLVFGTRGVVEGFGDISLDNRRVITMEWIAEGVALLSIAAFVAVPTALGAVPPVSWGVYGVAIATLLVMTVVSLFTGFRIAYLPYRLCPIVFAAAAALIAWGGLG